MVMAYRQPYFQDENAPIPRLVETEELSPEAIARVGSCVFMPHDPKPAEVLFIFGTVQADWEGLAESILGGAFNKVVLAGRFGPQYRTTGLPIAHVMRAELVARGVDPVQLVVQDRSDNTLEDVSLSLRVIGHPKTLTFAAKSHHSGRCARTLRRFLAKSNLHCHAYDAIAEGVEVNASTWHEHPVSRGYVMGEYQRILLYSGRGDISIYP